MACGGSRTIQIAGTVSVNDEDQHPTLQLIGAFFQREPQPGEEGHISHSSSQAWLAAAGTTLTVSLHGAKSDLISGSDVRLLDLGAVGAQRDTVVVEAVL
jgi:hypothetical protein